MREALSAALSWGFKEMRVNRVESETAIYPGSGKLQEGDVIMPIRDLGRRGIICLMLGLAVDAATAADVVSTDYSEVRSLWAEARASAEAHASQTLAQFDRLVAIAPANNELLSSAIAAAAAAHNRERLNPWLAMFAKQGGTLGANDLAAVGDALGTAADASTMRRLQRNAANRGLGQTALLVTPDVRLVEGLAKDVRSRTTYIASVIDKAIYKFDSSGARSRWLTLQPGYGSPMGMAIDAARGTLWVAVDADPFDGRQKLNSGGLLRVSLRSGEKALLRLDGERLHLGDLTAARDGTIYAADGRSGAIYLCRPGCAELETLVPPGRLRSAQGLAESPDGGRLWVSDYAYGLLTVDLANRVVQRAVAPTGEALDGIDGMIIKDHSLIAVQNGWQPSRIIAVDLDAEGTKATGVRVLARGGAAAEEPTQIADAGGSAILVVSNSQWSRYDGSAPPSPQSATRISRLTWAASN